MPDSINKNTFAELQNAAGAEFVPELVDTFLQQAPAMLAERRSALDALQESVFALGGRCMQATVIYSVIRGFIANGVRDA